jgi:pimeloyl-ACP methyl ester carboxylesterase
MQIWDRFWHKTLRRPYILTRTVDQGSGPAVVLLHGIGRSGDVWKHVVSGLQGETRVVALDLLGFGASPKPTWPRYDSDDHARAVIATIEKLRLQKPAILVGHSMGALVSARVARLRPDLARHLVLYEMPLYSGLPKKRIYQLRLNLYFRLYQRIVAYQPSFDPAAARRLDKMAQRIAGFEVTKESWTAFERSLENTIMNQTAADDIKQISVPTEVIYGALDMLVIRGKPQQIFGEDSEHVSSRTIRALHVISPKASRFLVGRIEAALNGETEQAVRG